MWTGDFFASDPVRLLSHDLAHHLAADVREPVIAAAVSVGQPGVVDPEEMENRRV